jgi:Hint domain
MSWIAMCDARQQSGRTNALTGIQTGSHDTASLLARATLVLEFQAPPDDHAPRRLLHYQASHGWQRRFTVYLNADRSLAVETQQGQARSYVRLANAPGELTGAQRLSYIWDAPARHGLLALEDLETCAIHYTRFVAPIPIPLGDATAALCAPTAQLDPSLVFSALSDRIQPIGPAATIGAGALIDTPQGARPIDRLQLGDTVLTRDNGAQPVRWILKQERPARGPHAPIRLRAPYLGLSSDLLVGPSQRIVIAGAKTEYTFGRDAVLIPAHHLAAHAGASVLNDRDTMVCYQILLDNHDCIRVSGAWCDSLYVGDLADTPDVLRATALNAVPPMIMPRHDNYVHPVLRNYESRAILDAMIA